MCVCCVQRFLVDSQTNGTNRVLDTVGWSDGFVQQVGAAKASRPWILAVPTCHRRHRRAWQPCVARFVGKCGNSSSLSTERHKSFDHAYNGIEHPQLTRVQALRVPRTALLWMLSSTWIM
jgi:hypothetical protein